MGHRARAQALLVLTAAPLMGVDWPASDAWQPLERDASPLEDAADTTDPALDLRSDGAAVGGWYADGDHLFFRMRVDGEPGPTWGAPLRRYGVLLDLNADPVSYELAIILSDGGLDLADNTAGTRADGWTDPPDDGALRVSDDPVDGDLVQAAPDGDGWWLAIAVPVADLEAARPHGAYDHAAAFRVALVTDDDGGGFSADLAGAPEGAVLADGLSDPVVVDADGDGLALGDEQAAGTDPDDPDSDGDGIDDGAEVGCAALGDPEDRDGDWIPDLDEGTGDHDDDGQPDFCDPDDDGDGWSTRTEGTVDTDRDGHPDYLDDDSDGDGVLDRDEPLADSDCDGTRDRLDDDDAGGPCGDADGDGLTNDDERACGADPTQPDTDGDGALDGNESCSHDSDGDGIVDVLDPTDDPAPRDEVGAGRSGAYGYTGGDVGGGGGCRAAPGRASVLLGVIGGLLAWGRRRAGALVGLVVGGAASAQELDAQTHRPALGGTDLLTVHDGRRDPGAGAAVRVHQAADPVVYRTRAADGVAVDEPLLAVLGTVNLLAWGRLGPARLGVDVPVHLQVAGPAVVERPGTLGDVAADIDLALLPGGHRWGVSVGGRATAPTGDGRALVGAAGPTAQVRVAGSYGAGPVRVAAEAGMRWAPDAALGALPLGDALTGGVGARWRPRPWGAASVELSGAHHLPAAGLPGATPIEVLAGVHARPAAGVQASLGAGWGLTGGLGAPRARGIAQLRVRPSALRP